jgi:D-beta-D-heptose 7-phosphate kinase/D-beta-D-heptose 1-phosphate adenosyltransferase
MKNVLLLGDIVIDIYHYGSANRLSNEGCFPVIKIDNIVNKLGCLGNVLENIHEFFDKIYLITCINEDTVEPLNKLLDSKFTNVEYTNFNQKNRKLINKNRIYCDNRCIYRFDIEENYPIDKDNENKIMHYIHSIIKNIDIALLSDYLKGFLTKSFCKEIITLCNQKNKIVMVDPKGTDYTKYKNCTLIKPNKREAEEFFEKKINPENINDFSNKLINEYNIKYILNTLGSEGMRFIYKDVNGDIAIIKKNIIPSQVIDVLGCGDTILSVICIYYSIYNNFDNIEELLDIMSKIGKVAVDTSGCYHLNKKDWNEINKIKKKIIFTNGCFDIIHLGHLKFLKECKKLGDKLIIGINSDESIKRLKGNLRPINNIQDRINFLKELNLANEIIPFEQDTPLDLIKNIRPDVLVKGGDYKLSNVIGKEYVDETVILPYLNGYSTTNIIQRTLK